MNLTSGAAGKATPLNRGFTFLEHLAPASQPTPPSVRYPGGTGLKTRAVFYYIARPAQDALVVYINKSALAMLQGTI